MENIDINFLLKNGWMEYPETAGAPKNCFYKNQYPIALWWDEAHEVFFVIDLKKKNQYPVLEGENPIKTVMEYDNLISPILEALKDVEAAKRNQ